MTPSAGLTEPRRSPFAGCGCVTGSPASIREPPAIIEIPVRELFASSTSSLSGVTACPLLLLRNMVIACHPKKGWSVWPHPRSTTDLPMQNNATACRYTSAAPVECIRSVPLAPRSPIRGARRPSVPPCISGPFHPGAPCPYRSPACPSQQNGDTHS